MGVKLILLGLFALTAFFIVSCASEPKIEQSMPAIYIVGGVEEPQTKTFVVGEEEDPLAWYRETKQQRSEQNMRRSLDDYGHNQKEFELKSKLSNVRRAVGDEVIFGFDEDIDNSRWEEVDD